MLAKPHMTTDLLRFCTSDQLSHPLSVASRFNFGKLDVTPFTYKHLFLKSKQTGMAPSFIGSTAIECSKQKSEYKKIVQLVANSTPHLAERGKGFITDGEEALYSALGEVMWHATGLRCFRHFQQNCRDKQNKIGTCKRNDQKPFVDRVFEKPTSEGVLYAEDKPDLKANMLEAKDPIHAEKLKLTKNETPEFWRYFKSHKKMMIGSMIARARSKAGMPSNISGNPVKCYTNQSESINSNLTRQKEALAKNDKSKVDLTKLQLRKDVLEEVDRHQQEEVKLAICGLSNVYELADVVAHLSVQADDWFEMNEGQRKAYVNEFNKMPIVDAMKGKAIRINHIPTGALSKCKEFSLDATKIFKALHYWTDRPVATILQSPTARVFYIALDFSNAGCV